MESTTFQTDMIDSWNRQRSSQELQDFVEARHDWIDDDFDFDEL